MLNYDIEQKEIEKSEFLSKAEIQGLKTYPKNQVQEFANMYKGLMNKAEVQELSPEEEVQMKIFKSEFESLKKVVVVNEDLSKSEMYYRSKDDISKSEAIESEFKALSLQNECEVLVKSFEANIITEETLEKAIGGKYFKREPKPGGGYKYYYTEAQYKKEKGGDKKEPTKENKVFSVNSSVIGSSKYSINSHDGESKHKDGSDFIGISTAKSKKELDAKIKDYQAKGYKMVPSTFNHLHNKKSKSKETFSTNYKKFAEGVKSDVKENNDLADYYIERLQKDIKQSGQRIKSIKKEANGEDFTRAISAFEERIKDASILSKQIKEITGEYKK